MPQSTQETKIELVTEAIDALVLATVIAQSPTAPHRNRTRYQQDVLSAREEVRKSLRELLTPTLRVVTSQRTDTVGEISTTLTRTVAEASRTA